MVTHTCNPRGRRSHDSNQLRQKVTERPHLKKQFGHGGTH
jgi:hypothetical protein